MFASVLAPIAAGGLPADPLELATDVDASLSDPFVVRRGLRASLAFRPVERVALGVGAGGYPVLGDADLTPLTHDLVERDGVAPQIARALWRVGGEIRVDLARTSNLRTVARVGAFAGVGAVRTRDDALGADETPEFLAARDQIHPTWSIGLEASVSRGPVGFTTRLERASWSEGFGVEPPEITAPLWVAIGVVWRPPLGVGESHEIGE